MAGSMGINNITRISESTLKHLLIFILIPLAVIPFNPHIAGIGHDASWVTGINEALAQGLVFGKDIIFTYGPYNGIFVRYFHPETDSLRMFSACYFTLCYIIGFSLLCKDNFLRSIILIIGFFFSIALHTDVLILAYPMLVFLCVFKAINKKNQPQNKLSRIMEVILLSILFSAFGLQVLTKGTAIIGVSGALGLSVILLVINKRFASAVAIAMTSVISLFFFWWLAGYHHADVANYLINMLQIISGYSEAMFLPSSDRGKLEIALFIITSGFMVFGVLKNKTYNNINKLFLLLSLGVFLLAGFKAGFVRHDGHVVIAAGFAMFAVLMLQMVVPGKYVRFAILFTILNMLYTAQNHYGNAWDIYGKAPENAWKEAGRGIRNRQNNNYNLNELFYSKKSDINRDFPIDEMEGTADIYAFQQAYLLASGNQWSPRPVFQGYSVYTPKLLEINEAHLRSKRAPDNIVFRVETIDERYPTLDDGLSWPTILYNYKPVKLKDDFLYLHKKNKTNMSPPLKLIDEFNSELNQEILVPKSNYVLYTKIDIRPTIFGKLASILFKPTMLRMTVKYEDGNTRDFRIISGMAKSGFIISPSIETTEDFNKLFNVDEMLDLQRPVSIRISDNALVNIFWKDKVEISYWELTEEGEHDRM